MAAIDRLNDSTATTSARRRFTISTSGLVPAIRKFTRERRQVNLAFAARAEDALRGSMMPVNKKYSVERTHSGCREYVETPGVASLLSGR